MKYRKFGNTGLEISALGFGTMRFPLNEDGSVNQDEAVRMVRHAIDSGVNYVDTAYPYHKGESEVIVGKALRNGYREKTYLATKCPVWLVNEDGDFERILDEQLKKLETDTIDFYLLHALDRGRFEEKIKKFNLIDRMEQARAAGKIKYIGFSFHDSYELFQEIIDFYDGWDFCQIQYNYINLEHQAGLKGLKYAAGKGLGVIVMEPLLGGRLSNLEPHVKKEFGEQKSVTEYALDFLWDQPEVGFLLSGMSTFEQVEENLACADRSSVGMVTGEEKAMYQRAKEIFDQMALVGCTGCGYCMPCPFGLQIPDIFSAYNMTVLQGEEAKEAYSGLELKADACKKCRHCEQECPQHIEISQVMKKVADAFKRP